ncbi:outer membrane protein [uncultured Helicobacter sp.]|uniref:outer membrane protein n=1 Tax=uncultured Helicobacter sp. TaxID=175537 RepID=UPI00374EE139
MKAIQKYMLSLIGASVLASGVYAEKSGGYLAVEVGGAKSKFKQDIDATAIVFGVPQPVVGDITADNILPAFYLKGGYKFMFGERGRFGVRPYIYFGYGYGSMKNISYNGSLGLVTLVPGASDSIFTGTGKTYYNHFFDYGVGADLLYNFVDNENESFGIFAGVAIGGETWVANGKEYKPSQGSEVYANFQTILNIGLRSVLAKHHGIELGAKFYMLDSVIFEGSGSSPLMDGIVSGISVNLNSTKTTMRRPYMISLAYTYNF